MVKSMYAAVAGLKSHQSKMDIIGNNIANVNTTGYKSASVSFQDTIYQTTSSGKSGSTSTGGTGGTNSSQVGYGVTIGSITYDFAEGGLATSSNTLDCMIDSDNGFFIVGPMVDSGTISLEDTDAISSSGLYLTRVGSFQVDSNGYLTDSNGNYVYCYVNTGDLTDSSGISTSSLSLIKVPTTADLADIANSDATSAVTAAQTALTTAKQTLNSLNLALGTARQDYIEAQEVYTAACTSADIENLETTCEAKETAMTEAYESWQEDTSDTTLKAAYYAAKLEYDKANYALVQAEAVVMAPDTLATYSATDLSDAWDTYESALTAFASASTTDSDYSDKKTALETAQTALEKIETALTTVEDDSPAGLLATAESAVETAEAKVTSATTAVTQAQTTLTLAQSTATTTAVSGASGDDDTLATITAYSIASDGTITATTEDGDTLILGKIALANVQNTGGLEKTSGYYYTIGSNAGSVSAYEADDEILSGYTELSNVDLATEMTEMITTQRGFQANSKIITVTDTMLEELVNMKR